MPAPLQPGSQRRHLVVVAVAPCCSADIENSVDPPIGWGYRSRKMMSRKASGRCSVRSAWLIRLVADFAPCSSLQLVQPMPCDSVPLALEHACDVLRRGRRTARQTQSRALVQQLSDPLGAPRSLSRASRKSRLRWPRCAGFTLPISRSALISSASPFGWECRIARITVKPSPGPGMCRSVSKDVERPGGNQAAAPRIRLARSSPGTRSPRVRALSRSAGSRRRRRATAVRKPRRNPLCWLHTDHLRNKGRTPGKKGLQETAKV